MKMPSIAFAYRAACDPFSIASAYSLAVSRSKQRVHGCLFVELHWYVMHFHNSRIGGFFSHARIVAAWRTGNFLSNLGIVTSGWTIVVLFSDAGLEN
jgi:hypothetical protein